MIYKEDPKYGKCITGVDLEAKDLLLPVLMYARVIPELNMQPGVCYELLILSSGKSDKFMYCRVKNSYLTLTNVTINNYG